MKYKILLILTLFSHIVYGQDSILVNETCMKLHAMKNPDDYEKKSEIITDYIKKHVPVITSDSSKQEALQAFNRYSYKFFRELRRTCSEFEGDPITLRFNVIDIESKLKGAEFEEKDLKRVEAIIYSMTKKERKVPAIINGSCRKRIATGSGTRVQDVNKLLKQFAEAKKMMKGLTKMKSGGKKMPFKMPF